MTPSLPFVSWEAQGRNAAPLLEKAHAVVIAGPDPAAAASFALGVARVQGSVRRVAIADLVGEVPPLQALVRGDDAHGISDSFLYGVSLNKIAQPLEGSGNVFLMPSGTEPVATETVYNNDRWRKLAAGFQQVGALLLIVAVPGTPGFAELCSFVGAVFPIGDLPVRVPGGVAVIAMPRPTPPEVERVVMKARAIGSEDADSRRRKLIAIVCVIFGLAVLFGIMWPNIRAMLPDALASKLPGGVVPAASAVPADSTKQPAPLTDSATRDTTGSFTTAGDSARNGIVNAAGTLPDSTRPPAPLPRTTGSLSVSNPEDSSRAAAYAVYLVAANSRESAITDPRVQSLPAVAISPVILGSDGVRWYRVTVGASEDQATIDALVERLRLAKVLGPTSGTIVRVPYAFRLEQGVAESGASDAIAKYAKRGISAYALKQADGRITVYTGAHESVVQAAILADSLRTMGIMPVLVYRTGRAF